jgi:hypothetical protein
MDIFLAQMWLKWWIKNVTCGLKISHGGLKISHGGLNMSHVGLNM